MVIDPVRCMINQWWMKGVPVVVEWQSENEIKIDESLAHRMPYIKGCVYGRLLVLLVELVVEKYSKRNYRKHNIMCICLL